MSAEGNQETHGKRSALSTKDRITFLPPKFPGQVGLISCSASSIHDTAFIMDPIKTFAELNRGSITAAADDAQFFGDNSKYYEAIEDARAEKANGNWDISVARNKTEIWREIQRGASFMILSKADPTEPCLTHPWLKDRTEGVVSQTPDPKQASCPPSAFQTEAGLQIDSRTSSNAEAGQLAGKHNLSAFPDRKTGLIRIIADTLILDPLNSNIGRAIIQCLENNNSQADPDKVTKRYSKAMRLSKGDGKMSRWTYTGERDGATQDKLLKTRRYFEVLPAGPGSGICFAPGEVTEITQRLETAPPSLQPPQAPSQVPSQIPSQGPSQDTSQGTSQKPPQVENSTTKTVPNDPLKWGSSKKAGRRGRRR